MRVFDYPVNEAAHRILAALKIVTPDLDTRDETIQLLARFKELFPPESLRKLGLHDYCLGEGNKDSFCNWIEKKLVGIGRYAVGSSRSHFIFKQLDGKYYVIKDYEGLPLEEALEAVLELHARIVERGGSSAPESISGMSLEWPGHRAKLFAPDKVPSRVLKLCHSYYPDRFFPINSVFHLDTYLEGLGVPKGELPSNFIEKNLLLQSFFERHVEPMGLTSIEFMEELYNSEIAPFSIDIKKREALVGAIRYFSLYYGPKGFSSALYLEDERHYKDALKKIWDVSATRVRTAETESDLAAVGRSVAKILLPSKQNNLINWRYSEKLTNLDEQGAVRLARATKALLESMGEAPDVESFNKVLFSLDGGVPEDFARLNPASRSMPTLLLWLENPDEDIYLRSESLSMITKAVTGKDCVRTGILTNRDYVEWRKFAATLKEELTDAGLEPHDLIDVQGFIWRVTMSSNLWFCGCSFEKKDDQLERFKKQGIWAWHLEKGKSDDILLWISNHPNLDGYDLLESPLAGAKKDLRNQFGSLARLLKQGGMIVAKRTYFDRSSDTSLLGIDGLCRVEPSSTLTVDGDDLIVPATWMESASLVLENTQFGKVSHTIQNLDLAVGLSILGQPEKPLATASTNHRPSPQLQSVSIRHSSETPLNLILCGPPGTGKTYRLRTDYMEERFTDRIDQSGGTVTERFSFVTFHQNYSYEDFVEGLRPVVDREVDEGRDFELRPGIFKNACRMALRLAGFEGSVHEFCMLTKADRDAWYLGKDVPGFALFIDEINRGNISKIFGELITLIEDDKRLMADNELIVMLPNSQERFGVPPNLHLIGTMNTADRSIALLDTALRRRFEFIELLPDYKYMSGLPASPAGIDVQSMLMAMNERIEFLYDREHQIGHAYFKRLADSGLTEAEWLRTLASIFKKTIVPLLAEYFFDDWLRIAQVLGDDEKDPSHRFIQHADSGRWVALGTEIAEANGNHGVWRVREESFMDPDAYRGIYSVR